MNLPDGWVVKPLAEVVEIQRGFDLPHHARRPGPFPVLTSGETGGFHDEGPVKGPGMTIGRATNLGKPKWSESDFWPHNTTMFVKDFKGNVRRWVYHLFENTNLAGFDSGSVQPMLNRNYIAQVPVVVPPLGVQKAIAEVLGALDDKIAANTTMANTAQELMCALVAGAPDEATIDALARQRTTQLKPHEFTDRVAHFSLPAFDAGVGPEHATGVSIKSNKFELRAPSVLLSKLNPRIPRVWNVPVLPDSMSLASTEFVVLEPVEMSTSELWASLAQPSMWSTLAGKVAGTSGSHQRVKPAEIMTLIVKDPRGLPPEKRSSIRDLGLRCDSARAESERLATTRDALLPGLMSGKIRVKDAEQVVEGVV